MRFKPQLLLTLSVFVLIVSGTFSAAQSQTNNQIQPDSQVEKCIWERVVYEKPINVSFDCANGGVAVIGVVFLYDLLTKPPQSKYGVLAGIWISHVTVVGNMPFTYRGFSYDVALEDCHFLGNVSFNDSKFEKSFSLARSKFDQWIDFRRMEVVRDFVADGSRFPGGVFLYDMNIGGNVVLEGLRSNGQFVLSRTIIKGNLVLIDVHLLGSFLKDFSVTTTDNLIFQANEIQRPYTLNGLSFRLLFSSPDEMLNFVEGADYYPIYNDVYQNLENFYRQRDSLVNAKAVHVAWKKRELSVLASESDFRSKLYLGGSVLAAKRDFWPRLYLGLNLLHYVSTGYSQHFELALLWSAIFIAVGYAVFRKKQWMEYTHTDDTWPLRYHPLWYSIALFLPVVSLQDKEKWTPKADRTKSRFYMRLHIILGYILIPIGILAITGLIK